MADVTLGGFEGATDALGTLGGIAEDGGGGAIGLAGGRLGGTFFIAGVFTAVLWTSPDVALMLDAALAAKTGGERRPAGLMVSYFFNIDGN